jgi:hypothetical protein
MSLRRFATGAALAIAGLVAAVGIGLLANSISGDNVGLSAEPLSAGETLAPKADDRARDRAKQAARERARQRAAARRRAKRQAAQQPADRVEVPAPGPEPTTTTFDDHGGLRDGSDDNSGSGSSSSGSGSGGSDDPPKIDDD